MNISGIKLGLMTLFNVIFVIVFGYILLNTSIFPFKIIKIMNPVVILLGVIIVLSGLYFLNKRLEKCNEKRLMVISIGSFIILIILQFFFARYFTVNPTWDFGKVYDEAYDLSIQFRQIDQYFYFYCPNNLPILLLVTGLFKIFRFMGFTDLLKPLIVVNLSIVFLSVWIMYLFIKEMYGLQRATLFSILSILITPFYTYTTIVYTDTLGMILPILSLYLYAKIYRSPKKEIGLLVTLGLVLGLGGLLKTHALVVLVAILIHYFLTRKDGFIRLSAPLILMVLVTMMSYKLAIKPLIPVASSEVGFPKTHWVMMGLKGLGGYDDEDTNMTRFLKDSGWSNDEIQAQHIRLMKERLEAFGVGGFINHLNSKLNFTWSDGTYFAPEKLKREPIVTNNYQDYIFGDKNLPYLYLSQMVHVVILFLMWLSSIRILKDKLCFESVMTISVFGVMLFLLIWETRSRYLMIYLPVFVVLASYGFGEFTQMIQKIKRQ